MGTYSDRHDTSTYATYLLGCGHVESIDAQMLRRRPDHLFWCTTCAELHRVAKDEGPRNVGADTHPDQMPTAAPVPLSTCIDELRDLLATRRADTTPGGQ